VDVGHVRGQVDEGFDGREDHTAVGGAQHGVEHVHDAEHLLVVDGVVARHELEHLVQAPLVEVVEATQQVVDQRLVHGHAPLRQEHLVENHDAVRHHAAVGVADHVVQQVHEVRLLYHGGRQVVELQHAHHARLAHVGVHVRQRLAQRLGDVFDDGRQAQGAERAQRQPPHHWVLVVAVPVQRVDAHERHVRVLLSVLHQVQVHHFLHDDVLRLHAEHHLRKEPRHVNSQGHVRNDLFDGVALLLQILCRIDGPQQGPELRDLTFLRLEVGAAGGTTRGRRRRR
jgi:hypothetical protein